MIGLNSSSTPSTNTNIDLNSMPVGPPGHHCSIPYFQGEPLPHSGLRHIRLRNRTTMWIQT